MHLDLLFTNARIATMTGNDLGIIEQGSHDALLQQNGAYARLHGAQFRGFAAE